MAMMDEEVNAARQVLAAVKFAKEVVEKLRSSTVTTQNTGVDWHTVA